MTSPSRLDWILAELQRRKVLRAAAVYGAGSFALLQAADILLPRLGLPESLVTWIAGIALALLPLVVVLAWTFERTPAGVRQTRAPAEGELEALAARPASSRWLVGSAALLGVMLLTGSGWFILGRSGAEAGMGPGSGEPSSDALSASQAEADGGEGGFRSIAVLPFVNLSGAEEDEYLGDGLSEELMYALTRIEGLNVASRTSAFAFKNSTASVRTIADSLGVGVVLQGSVRRSSDRLRITAQLTRADTGFELWTERYDRSPDDLLDIQEDLTRRMIDALAPRLARGTGPVSASRGTSDPNAYNQYLRGRYFWNKRTPEDMRVARVFFQNALDADPEFAHALSALADTWAVPAGWEEDPGVALDEAERRARAALEIDPSLAQAHASLAFVLMMRDLDFGEAEAAFRRALELDPLYATAHQWYAELLIVTDRRDRAVEEARLAMELDPTEIIRWNYARILYFARRYDEAIQVAEATAAAPNAGLRGRSALIWVVQSNVRLGRWEAVLDGMTRLPGSEPIAAMIQDSLRVREEGVAEFMPDFLALSQLASIPPDAPDHIRRFAEAQALSGDDPVAALRALEAAVNDLGAKHARIVWFEVLADPEFDKVRALPEFQALDTRVRY